MTSFPEESSCSRSKDGEVANFQAARERFALYEKFYLSLHNQARNYLREESGKYKIFLKEIQDMIMPAVERICPACEQCCRLAPIYLTGTVGCFNLVDYLLARCDTALPRPRYKNMEVDLCPFWDQGCILPVDSRSFACLNFFCDKLEKELDMEPVLAALDRARAVLERFSIGRCMK